MKKKSKNPKSSDKKADSVETSCREKEKSCKEETADSVKSPGSKETAIMTKEKMTPAKAAPHDDEERASKKEAPPEKALPTSDVEKTPQKEDMVNSANDLNRIAPRDIKSGSLEKEKKSIEQPYDSSPAADSAHLQPEFLLKLISGQIGKLKSELPGIISDAVLSHEDQEAIRKAPITALNFRLYRPLQYYLHEENKLSADQVLALREIIQQFKDEIPALRDQALLTHFRTDSNKAMVLNAILASLSSQLDGIISTLYQSLTF